jgi:glycosyltransferase involved in cell wall biosynthesis
LYSAADCLVVTSESEGSPNVVYEAIATGLPSILYATEGTEDIVAPLVTRLPRRDIDALVAAMLEAARRGPAAREFASRDWSAPIPHPLVEYYRGELQGRDRS